MGIPLSDITNRTVSILPRPTARLFESTRTNPSVHLRPRPETTHAKQPLHLNKIALRILQRPWKRVKKQEEPETVFVMVVGIKKSTQISDFLEDQI